MKLSVVIPAYNRAALISRAVSSIPSNSSLGEKNSVEIIIVDDGSTDNTAEVVAGLSRKDSRIIFIQLAKNKGVNHARNRGIDRATGDWLSFLDSDDEYVTGGIEEIFSTLLGTPTDIDVVGFMTLREIDGIMAPRGYNVGGNWKEHRPTYEDIILKRNIFGDIHFCVRREALIGGLRFLEGTQTFEVSFFGLLAKRGNKFLYVNKIVDRRYTGPGYHLSDEPYRRWPRKFARAYSAFVNEHYAVLSMHPDRLRYYCLRIAKCYLSVGDPRGLWWLVRSFMIRV